MGIDNSTKRLKVEGKKGTLLFFNERLPRYIQRKQRSRIAMRPLQARLHLATMTD